MAVIEYLVQESIIGGYKEKNIMIGVEGAYIKRSSLKSRSFQFNGDPSKVGDLVKVVEQLIKCQLVRNS